MVKEETANFTFGLAIEAIKKGIRVARKGWNGKNMWLEYVSSDKYTSLSIHNGLLPWIGMKTADDCFVPWLASQTDMLAEDWEIIDGGEPKGHECEFNCQGGG